MRNTKARNLILDVLNKTNAPLNAEEIYELIKDNGIDLSTVYRTLKVFVLNGIVQKDFSNDGKACYVIHKEEHMHILECVKCHEKILLNECPFHEINKKILKTTGFVVNDQNVILYGVCKKCN